MSSRERLIIPAILERDPQRVTERIALFEGVAPWVHLDVSDGVFAAPASTIAPDAINTLGGRARIEVHLMVQEPERQFRPWAAVADRVIVHREAGEHLRDLLDVSSTLPSAIACALKLETPLEELDDFEGLTQVHLMSIAEIGAQGHVLDERIFSKISALRKKMPSVTISVDGGITLEHVPRLLESGADLLVVGSALMRSADPLATFHRFNQALS